MTQNQASTPTYVDIFWSCAIFAVILIQGAPTLKSISAQHVRAEPEHLATEPHDRSMLDTAEPALSSRIGYETGASQCLDSSKADDFTSSNFFLRYFGRLQDVEAAGRHRF